MASVTDICNRALQKVGAARITSISEDTVEARACNTAYDPIRRAMLRDHDWNCAIKRASLAADATEPEWGRDNAFTLPSDFIRLAPQYPEDNHVEPDWQIENGKILTDDDAPLDVRYVYDLTDVARMDPLLREVIAAALAVEICEELTQSNTKKAGLEADLEKAIARAKRTNAIENVSQEFPEDTWLTCRG